MSFENAPLEHIAFIMDGNGRWAKKRLLSRSFGHREGVKTLEIQVAKGKISAAAGQKNMNKQYFSKEYSINKIVFKENSALNGREFIINPDFA